jgi:hypothetical protein
MSQTKEEIIGKYIDAYNSFDIDSMLALLHTDVSFRNIANGEETEQINGKSEIEMLARQSAELFKTRSQVVRSLQIKDEKATMAIDFEAVLAQDLPNGLKAGETISFEGKSEILFKDGLIVSITDEI